MNRELKLRLDGLREDFEKAKTELIIANKRFENAHFAWLHGAAEPLLNSGLLEKIRWKKNGTDLVANPQRDKKAAELVKFWGVKKYACVRMMAGDVALVYNQKKVHLIFLGEKPRTAFLRSQNIKEPKS